MNEARIRFQTTPDRFTTEEKLSIIREMNKRGGIPCKGLRLRSCQRSSQLRANDLSLFTPNQ